MIYIIFLFVVIILATSNNMTLHAYHNRDLDGLGDVLLFNGYVSCIWFIVFFALNAFKPISAATMLWGIAYGISIAAFLLCKMQAMATGPISISTFVGCSALLICTLFGVFYYNESVTPLQVVGLVLLMVALFLTVSPKGGQSKKGWLLWCTLFLLSSSTVGIMFKLHQNSPERDNITGMLLCSSVVSAVLYFSSALVIARKQKQRLPRVPKSAFPWVLAIGLVSSVYNRLNITVSGHLPSIVFFPSINGSVIFLASLSGAVLFHEKLKPVQWIGLVLGLFSLCVAAGIIHL